MGFRAGPLLGALCAVVLTGCGGEPAARADGAQKPGPRDVEIARVSPEEQAKAAAEIAADEAARDAKVPANVPPPPLTGFCMSEGTTEEYCEASRTQIGTKDWPRAWGGDYQGQRNVAYCLFNGCDGAVQVNQVQACAWRQVIQASGNIEVNELDLDQQKLECGQLDDAGRTAARAQARDIFKKIYRREMT